VLIINHIIAYISNKKASSCRYDSLPYCVALVTRTTHRGGVGHGCNLGLAHSRQRDWMLTVWMG